MKIWKHFYVTRLVWLNLETYVMRRNKHRSFHVIKPAPTSTNKQRKILEINDCDMSL
ncbi:hypothetical protein ACHWQZ_G019060 [Mnemiopsis leidyi]